MTPNRILHLNALSTAACAVGMLVTRGTLHSLFGLETPLLLDALAVGLLAYAGALVIAARRQQIDRATLMTFTIADAVWVLGSAVLLLLYWEQFTPVARALVIAVAVAVEAFATLQYRAARVIKARTLEMA